MNGHLIKAYCGTVNDKDEVCPNFKDKLAAGCSNYVWAAKVWLENERKGREEGCIGGGVNITPPRDYVSK